jgi:hypothetical protein
MRSVGLIWCTNFRRPTCQEPKERRQHVEDDLPDSFSLLLTPTLWVPAHLDFAMNSPWVGIVIDQLICSGD